MKAAGMSLYRVAAPVLLLSVLCRAGLGALPGAAAARLNELGDEVDNVKIRGNCRAICSRASGCGCARATAASTGVELLNPAASDMYGVTRARGGPEDFRLKSRLDARRAHWTPDGWELNDGAFREFGPNGEVQTVPS